MKNKKQNKKQARRASNLGHRAYQTRYDINFHMVTVTRRSPDGYLTVVNYLTRLDIPSIINFTIISRFTDIHSSNHIFRPILTLLMPRKWKPKNKTKRNTIRVRRRSNLGHRAYQTRHGINFHMVTVTRRLSDGYLTVVNYLTRLDIPLILNFIIIPRFTDIHSFNHTFCQTLTLPVPGKWETKAKTKIKEKIKEKIKQARRRSNLGHPAYPGRRVAQRPHASYSLLWTVEATVRQLKETIPFLQACPTVKHERLSR
jgi:hypothetical protein